VSDEVEFEPIPGLPGLLPPGETLLWQGRPSWRSLARHTFEVRWLAAYFAVFTALRGIFLFRDGQTFLQALLSSLIVVPAALLCLGLFTLLAFLNARATVYSITSKRVVMRFGVAFPMTFNFPFKRVAAADLSLRPGGDGDIALRLSGPGRIAYLPLWPHARPWHFAKAQPMLRSIPDAASVAKLLAEAVRAWMAAEPAQAARSAAEAAAAEPALASGPLVTQTHS
jgi:hypothetical protein